MTLSVNLCRRLSLDTICVSDAKFVAAVTLYLTLERGVLHSTTRRIKVLLREDVLNLLLQFNYLYYAQIIVIVYHLFIYLFILLTTIIIQLAA